MKVLVVDDNPDHRELIETRMLKEFDDCEFIHITRQTELDSALERGECDVVLTDYRLSWTDGLSILRRVKERLPDTPVVMVTDTGSEEIAADGMKAGLSDYVLKGHLYRLPMAVRESLEKAKLRRDHLEALQQLKISEERYRAVSQLCSDYAYALRVEEDGTQDREWITEAFTRITGYSIEEFDRRGGWPALVHPDDREIALERCDHRKPSDPKEIEFRIITKDGEVRWVRDYARPVWDETQKRVTHIYGAGQDVTDRKRMEEERAQSLREQVTRAEQEAGEQRWRGLAEAIPQMVWTARPDGYVDYFNQRWFEYTGLTAQQSYAPDVWKAVLQPDDVQSCLDSWYESVQTGKEYQIECRFRRARDGTYRWQLGRALPVRDSQSRIVKWIGTLTDTDDQKRAEEARQQTQKLESLGLLAGGVAHDFNNLLTGIMGNASLAIDSMPAESPIRSMLQDILHAGRRAADLTRQLLAYSGKGRLYVKPVNLSDMVREISQLIRTSIPRKVDLRLDLENVPPIEADSGQIQQVVMNLVINAAESIGEDRAGTVLVTTALETLDADTIRDNFAPDEIEPGPYVRLEVQDTGYGMDDNIRSQIFDPFFTTKFMGRGLGLAATLGIIRGHKGVIKVSSTPGEGSIFKVLLPVFERTSPEKLAVAERQDLYGSGVILVVDDEEIVQKTAKAALERYGYSVLLAENGRFAIEIFRKVAGQIALVLLDMTMPVMSGEETLVQLKTIRPEVRVIASSGYNEAVAIQRFGGHGLAGFIQKPYTASGLAEKVKIALEKT